MVYPAVKSSVILNLCSDVSDVISSHFCLAAVVLRAAYEKVNTVFQQVLTAEMYSFAFSLKLFLLFAASAFVLALLPLSILLVFTLLLCDSRSREQRD